MGRIAKIINAIRGERNGAKVTDVKGDPGGGAISQAQQFNSAGDDTSPLPGDYSLFVEVPMGGFASVGNLDTKNAQTAQPGERRIYGRSSAGEQVCEIYLKNDGTIVMQNDSASHTIKPSGEVHAANAAGFYTLLPDGTFNANGFTITPDGTATSPTEILTPVLTAATSLTVGGIEVLGHGHPYSWTDPGGSGVTGDMQ